ncbi:MAG TPA: ThuA domain-containing protein [Verrucomicrobiae bacterium]|nr:ThuA domain-containing protein [Verrucomicrobiae bacterium]
MAFCLAFAISAQCAEPLRVFIRSGAKTHGPGMHEHPKFLGEWTKVLNERGARCEGGNQFPTAEQLAQTDVLLIYTADGGDLKPDQRAALTNFLKRGGGLVTLLDGVCGHDPHWWKMIVGAAWEYNHTKWRYTKLTMRVRDHTHPITAGAADFDLDDEVYDGLHTIPEVRVLADAEFVLKPSGTNSTASTKTIPQMWTLETNGYRAFTWIQGLRLKTFDVPQYRALLLRGIAWVGRRQDVNEFCTAAELAALQAGGSNPASFLLSPDSPEANRRAPEKFLARLETSKGDMVIEVQRDWSPHGADRFFNLVRGGYYDDARFFRIKEGTWAQFGINGDPEVSNAWRERNIPDDPRVLSNVRGTVAFAFAVPHGRTTQLFINLKDNSVTHDSEPFVPIGKVVEGMEAADALNAEYGESSGGAFAAASKDRCLSRAMLI